MAEVFDRGLPLEVLHAGSVSWEAFEDFGASNQSRRRRGSGWWLGRVALAVLARWAGLTEGGVGLTDLFGFVSRVWL